MLFLPLNLTFTNRRPRPSSAFYRAWTVAADRPPRLGEVMSLKVFAGKVFEASVVTVERDAHGRPLPLLSQYSRIGHLLRWRPDLQLFGPEAREEPHTGDRRRETEDPTPPSPGIFPRGIEGSEEGSMPRERRQSDGRRTAEHQEQATQPGGGP
jgi:hypothetical protein